MKVARSTKIHGINCAAYAIKRKYTGSAVKGDWLTALLIALDFTLPDVLTSPRLIKFLILLNKAAKSPDFAPIALNVAAIPNHHTAGLPNEAILCRISGETLFI